jgi:hypothetical protein
VNVARPLIIACGALATELREVLLAGDLPEVEVRYLPANLHNTPDRIVPALLPLLDDAVAANRLVFVAYADCGTGGLLDRALDRYPGVHRLPGAHCYEAFAGADAFAALHDREPGTFYLTDFLARHFDALVWQGLGLDRHPSLRDTYFANYRRVVLLSQNPDSALDSARRAAQLLGLPLEVHHTGLQPLHHSVAVAIGPSPTVVR